MLVRSEDVKMSAQLASDSAALSRTLAMLSQPDTAIVRQGEKALKPFLKTSSCILALMNQIRTSPEESIRHHAALLLKKRTAALYSKFNSSQKSDLKAQLLIIMTSEPIRSIGTALAGVVASIAKCVFSADNQWPELFALLLQLSQDPNENSRSLNYSLLEQVKALLFSVVFYLDRRDESGAQLCSHLLSISMLIETPTASRAGDHTSQTPHSDSRFNVHSRVSGYFCDGISSCYVGNSRLH